LPPTELRDVVNQLSEIVVATDRVLWKALATNSDQAASTQMKTAAFWEAFEKAQKLGADVGTN
jgi:hypothetical protein